MTRWEGPRTWDPACSSALMGVIMRLRPGTSSGTRGAHISGRLPETPSLSLFRMSLCSQARLRRARWATSTSALCRCRQARSGHSQNADFWRISTPREQRSTSGSTISISSWDIRHRTTNPPPSDLYEKEGLDRSLHLLVEFDRNDTVVERKKVVPPKLQGVSGGAIHCISRASYAGPLVAIATEHRKRSRILVGTRVRYFVQIARGLTATEPEEIFD